LDDGDTLNHVRFLVSEQAAGIDSAQFHSTVATGVRSSTRPPQKRLCGQGCKVVDRLDGID
jgi:hypothetical protein